METTIGIFGWFLILGLIGYFTLKIKNNVTRKSSKTNETIGQNVSPQKKRRMARSTPLDPTESFWHEEEK